MEDRRGRLPEESESLSISIWASSEGGEGDLPCSVPQTRGRGIQCSARHGRCKQKGRARTAPSGKDALLANVSKRDDEKARQVEVATRSTTHRRRPTSLTSTREGRKGNR